MIFLQEITNLEQASAAVSILHFSDLNSSEFQFTVQPGWQSDYSDFNIHWPDCRLESSDSKTQRHTVDSLETLGFESQFFYALIVASNYICQFREK